MGGISAWAVDAFHAGNANARAPKSPVGFLPSTGPCSHASHLHLHVLCRGVDCRVLAAAQQVPRVYFKKDGEITS